MKNLLTLCCALLVVSIQDVAFGQEMEFEFPAAICLAGEYEGDIRIPAPRILPQSEREAELTFVFSDDFPEDARAAMSYAGSIWASLLVAPQTIVVNAYWQEYEAGSNALASANSAVHKVNFANAPFSDVYFPVANANQHAGADLNGADPEIYISVNQDAQWYMGIDGETPSNQYDLVTVALHEIGHGLGFTSPVSMDEDGNGSIAPWGAGGLPVTYDLFVQLGTVPGVGSIMGYENLPQALGNAFTSENLNWNGANTMPFYNNEVVPLHAPSTWNGGSSYTHLDESTFPASNPNNLMTPSIGAGASIHNPGNIGISMLKDMTWELGCEQWYLPNDVDGGPAVLACFAPEGYTLAENQACAADIIASDSYCVDNNWDDICQDAYDCCLYPTEGCTSVVACNYDPNACTDDGSCIDICFDSNCFRIEMTDEYGDGWNGASWSLSNIEGTLGYEGGGLADGESGVQGACMEDGCYLFQVTDGVWPDEVGWTIYGVDGGPFSGGAGESFVVTFNSVQGCTDSQACNYDEDACSDDGSCIYEDNPATDMTATQWVLTLVEGCSGGEETYLMDFNADYTTEANDGTPGTWRLCETTLNVYEIFATYGLAWNGTEFNGLYTVPFGTGGGCCNLAPVLEGCTDASACNYEAAANWTDGSCTYPGCQDAMACNYDPLAGCAGPCDYPPAYLEGCTNPMSSNYNAIATVDDGSCDLSYMCGEGTVYDEVLGICLTNGCVGDFNGDGQIGAADLLDFLVVYGSSCE
ncbi:MAG: hypothetical protein ACPG9S_05895 [Flavobacteriales bacterium]